MAKVVKRKAPARKPKAKPAPLWIVEAKIDPDDNTGRTIRCWINGNEFSIGCSCIRTQDGKDALNKWFDETANELIDYPQPVIEKFKAALEAVPL